MNDFLPNSGRTPGRTKRYAWLLAPLLLAGIAAAYGWTQRTHIPLVSRTPIYRAESEVVIVTPPPIPGSDPASPAAPAPAPSMADELALIQSPEMARQTRNWINNRQMMSGDGNSSGSPAPPTQDDILKAVHVTNPTGTHLLTITADAADPKMASDLANATALAFRQWKQDMAAGDQRSTISKLQDEVHRAAQSVDQPETPSILPAPVNSAGNLGAAGSEQRRLDREIARDLYKRLKTALDTAQLQSGKVSGNVQVIMAAAPPKTPQP